MPRSLSIIIANLTGVFTKYLRMLFDFLVNDTANSSTLVEVIMQTVNRYVGHTYSFRNLNSYSKNYRGPMIEPCRIPVKSGYLMKK